MCLAPSSPPNGWYFDQAGDLTMRFSGGAAFVRWEMSSGNGHEQLVAEVTATLEDGSNTVVYVTGSPPRVEVPEGFDGGFRATVDLTGEARDIMEIHVRALHSRTIYYDHLSFLSRLAPPLP